jgi:hypothetical protein
VVLILLYKPNIMGTYLLLNEMKPPSCHNLNLDLQLARASRRFYYLRYEELEAPVAAHRSVVLVCSVWIT